MGSEVIRSRLPRPTQLFNTPMEFGLRSLLLLVEHYPRALNLDRLVYLDYLLVHSGDVEGGPPSVHPPVPLRAGTVLVRRETIEAGLRLMVSRDLIERRADPSGFEYRAADEAPLFLGCLESPYTLALRERARWVARAFGACTEEQVQTMFRRGAARWGLESTPALPEYVEAE